MQTVLIVIHMLIVVAMIVTVLLQRSEGGALGIGGGGGAGSFFSGRGKANLLTRATAILATLFFATSLGLTILASYTRTQKSVFEQPAASAPAGEAPKDAPQSGNLIDQLKKLDQTPPAPPAPEPAQAPPRTQ
ncbi:preprotein translocase subunit SecG [Rhodoblastus sphagnicola]|uniref:Protein-export membrane protein SecG n=1 Tax=Rhodoblastus sphagnicola TaxID=333368 RepID=A0A2S6MYQ5_9HYPH|nr:preprotein translocase subunit SecG [Rhodoblastus sphagnicola]MBB4196458.1 preprotein translocase subunit SecG [Rhodoblastus sphagnicola]PPQ27505.1 preprotein translocase subunit SecG [Rhodoblastus sphagnicola]